MKYPKHFVDMYAQLVALTEQGHDMLADSYDRNDPEMLDLDDKIEELEAELREMCAMYASETGADLDLDFDEEQWFEDLARQYYEEY